LEEGVAGDFAICGSGILPFFILFLLNEHSLINAFLMISKSATKPNWKSRFLSTSQI
jgi:hypothetical protein